MQSLIVDQVAVARLAQGLRERYGRDIRETEIVEEIAKAIGWQPEELMARLRIAFQREPEKPERPSGPQANDQACLERLCRSVVGLGSLEEDRDDESGPAWSRRVAGLWNTRIWVRRSDDGGLVGDPCQPIWIAGITREIDGQDCTCSLPEPMTLEDAVRACDRLLFGRPGAAAMAGRFSLSDAVSAVDEAWNAPFLAVQEALGVETGDLASQYWAGLTSEDAVEQTLKAFPPALWSRLPTGLSLPRDASTDASREISDEQVEDISRRFAEAFAEAVGMAGSQDSIDSLADCCARAVDGYVKLEQAWSANQAP